MILYVNGDSHAAAAEAVNPHAWACDDGEYFYLGQAPHPKNLEVSWSRIVSDATKMALFNHSQAGCSNERVLRTTREWLDRYTGSLDNVFVVISWSTWERQEWLVDDQWFQVGASGLDSVPTDLADRYKEFVSTVDWPTATTQAHGKIWDLHLELAQKEISHIFFNGDNDFSIIPKNQRFDWGLNYIDPYDPKMTYSGWLRGQGFQTVSPKSWHFGRDAHAAWGRFVLQYMLTNKLFPR